MFRESILAGCVALTLVACSSTGQPVAPETGGEVRMMQQGTDEEMRADVGGTILKVTTVKDQGSAIPMELQYLGLAEGGRIKLRILSTDRETNEGWRRRLQQEGYTTSTSGPVDFEQDPAKPFLMESYQVEILEVQASWVRYKITMSTEM
ncbi:MAG TPA: hypothetical protein VJ725_27905 [Thermoanaerobaculia bacterium]|nr:hypothetical protein [Thermoanaerobaculia bacterium]